ncbi:MAG: hypothetical protein WKF58_12225 [Ilumatobacteraceae bacterium]
MDVDGRDVAEDAAEQKQIDWEHIPECRRVAGIALSYLDAGQS